MSRTLTAAWGLLILAAGCNQTTSDSSPQPTLATPPLAGSQFDAGTAGRIQGRVTWTGPVPTVEPFVVFPHQLGGRAPNPHAPQIDPGSRGVGEAVIFLRHIDPARARAWDHAPVIVEHRDYQLQVRQGQRQARYGFVRRGDAIEMVSRQAILHSLHADGPTYFTLPFPDPDQPLSRRLDAKGIVELRSAVGYYWMRAHLFVDDHPYYTLTDAQGRFALEQVPPGRHEVVCWLPSWLPARWDRDPDSGLMVRLKFRAALESVQEVTLDPRGAGQVEFAVDEARFLRD